MCGRYALNLDDMPVDDLPQDEGPGAPRQSYNFAPGYHGLVFRADTPDWGAGPRRHGHSDDHEASGNLEESNTEKPEKEDHSHVSYKLQAMKWGLIPFWTKRNPDYASMMKTINCRDDSLSVGGGMWSTMKARKRCIVIAEGFYEWLKTGPKDKLPHHVKRKDGHLMCFAGLWDCVQYEGSDEKHYTYTIITTDSNKQLKFLHDRMPVILNPGSEDLKTWLDPSRNEWSRELQSLLKPFDGELEVYPVSKEVGKVGNNSPSFVIPINSKENKSNIANFFANASSQPGKGKGGTSSKAQDLNIKDQSKDHEPGSQNSFSGEPGTTEDYQKQKSGNSKRKASESGATHAPSPKKPANASTSPASGKLSATQNTAKVPQKSDKGTQRITKFFNSA